MDAELATFFVLALLLTVTPGVDTVLVLRSCGSASSPWPQGGPGVCPAARLVRAWLDRCAGALLLAFGARVAAGE
jgi:threonine/homoserine/homoserine lactone efflux protein